MSPLERIPVQVIPYNAEAPLPVLAERITPNPLFYVRSHFPAPSLDASTWRLEVRPDPESDSMLRLSLADIQRLPVKTVTVTLECAGNGRKQMAPTPKGTPWGYGAISTAEFSGAPLHALLEEVGLSPSATEVLFRGADRGEIGSGETISYARSLPVDIASHPDVILAWAMNGEPLPLEHGHPLRLVVPRWYAMASVKWLHEIRALTEPFRGYYQVEDYVYRGEGGVPEGTPVTHMRVRSLIARPSDGEYLPVGEFEIVGAAWSGRAPIRQVQVSVDDGSSWQEAALEDTNSPYAARQWRYLWAPERAGAYTLLARATDESGDAQPLESVWNEQGYGNNVVQRVQVSVG